MLSNRPANSYYSLQGTKGCYEGTRGFGDQAKVWLADFDGASRWRPFSDFEAEFLPERWKNPPEEALKADDVSGEYFELRDFVDSILHDTPPPMDVYDAMDFTVPGLVSEQSIASGGMPVEVPDFCEIETSQGPAEKETGSTPREPVCPCLSVCLQAMCLLRYASERRGGSSFVFAETPSIRTGSLGSSSGRC